MMPETLMAAGIGGAARYLCPAFHKTTAPKKRETEFTSEDDRRTLDEPDAGWKSLIVSLKTT
jgi:hypothetical protein